MRKWLDITGNPHISLEEADVYRKSDRYAVCEKHFTEDAFENMMRVRMVGGLLRLKKNAVPTENISGTSSANRADSRVNDASLSDNDEPIDISNAEVECSYAQEGNKTVDDKDGDASVPIAKRSGNSHNYCRHDQKKGPKVRSRGTQTTPETQDKCIQVELLKCDAYSRQTFSERIQFMYM